MNSDELIDNGMTCTCEPGHPGSDPNCPYTRAAAAINFTNNNKG